MEETSKRRRKLGDGHNIATREFRKSGGGGEGIAEGEGKGGSGGTYA